MHSCIKVGLMKEVGFFRGAAVTRVVKLGVKRGVKDARTHLHTHSQAHTQAKAREQKQNTHTYQKRSRDSGRKTY